MDRKKDTRSVFSLLLQDDKYIDPTNIYKCDWQRQEGKLKIRDFYLPNHAQKFSMCEETLWQHSVVSVVLKASAVETSVDSAVKRFLVTTRLEDQNRVLSVQCRS